MLSVMKAPYGLFAKQDLLVSYTINIHIDALFMRHMLKFLICVSVVCLMCIITFFVYASVYIELSEIVGLYVTVLGIFSFDVLANRIVFVFSACVCNLCSW